MTLIIRHMTSLIMHPVISPIFKYDYYVQLWSHLNTLHYLYTYLQIVPNDSLHNIISNDLRFCIIPYIIQYYNRTAMAFISGPIFATYLEITPKD